MSRLIYIDPYGETLYEIAVESLAGLIPAVGDTVVLLDVNEELTVTKITWFPGNTTTVAVMLSDSSFHMREKDSVVDHTKAITEATKLAKKAIKSATALEHKVDSISSKLRNEAYRAKQSKPPGK